MRFLLLLFIFSLVIVACQPTASGSVKPESVPTVDPSNERLYLAQKNYNTLCAHCHGWAGDGQPQPTIDNVVQRGYHIVPRHDSQGHTWQHPDQLLFATIKYGVQAPINFYPMLSFDEQFTDDEIFGIIEYIKQWWTDEQRQHQSNLTAQFEKDNPYWKEDNLSDEES